MLRWPGAGDLAWLGFRIWRAPAGSDWRASHPAAPMKPLRQGCLIKVSDPKANLTYPQFLDPVRDTAAQLALLIPTAAIMVLAIYSRWVLLVSPLRTWLTNSGRRRVFNRVAGTDSYWSALGLAFGARR